MAGSSKSTAPRRVRRGREEWRALVAQFEDSGQTREGFCAERGIGVSTLRRWCSRLREQSPAASAGAPVFVELSAEQSRAAASAPSWEVELQLDAGVRLRLRRVPC